MDGIFVMMGARRTKRMAYCSWCPLGAWYPQKGHVMGSSSASMADTLSCTKNKEDKENQKYGRCIKRWWVKEVGYARWGAPIPGYN